MTAKEATTRCRVCDVEVPFGVPRCPNCKAAQGELPPCPHCGSAAGTSPDTELRYACDICGGPRVPHSASFKSSGREVMSLRAADAARKARAAWRGGTIASGLVLAGLSLFFFAMLLLFGLGFWLTATALGTLVPAGVVFALAFARARAKSREIAPSIDAAWVSVTSELAEQAGGAVSADEVARKLGIDAAQAEELLPMLDVNAMVASPAHMRIEAPARGATMVSQTAVADAVAEAEAQALQEDALVNDAAPTRFTGPKS